ncbi:MAG: hypothetical protein U5R30_18285 [Deltaproteobacteria bacterium]|nr:hypothetical protein [Deltaproteobacteria bacterium]
MAAFDIALGINTRYFPIVRARIASINGEDIDRGKETQRRHGDDLARTFNLTFREDLLDDGGTENRQQPLLIGLARAQVKVLD